METKTFLNKSNSLSSEAVLFLHGLPGVKSKQNQDLAEQVSQKNNFDSYVCFYPGLGINPGLFSISESWHLALSYFLDLSQKYSKLHIVGHSFGGFFALRLNFMYQQLVGKTFLMSPLLHKLTEEQITRLVNEINVQYPQFKVPSPDFLYLQYNQLMTEISSAEIKKGLRELESIKIIQAQDDQITPTQFAREFVLNTNWTYSEVDQDHSFVKDRNGLIELVTKYFND